MHELIPAAKDLALLINPLGPEIRVLHVRAAHELEAAFATLAQRGANGLVIGVGQPLTTRGEQLGQLAARHSASAIHESREFVAAGVLASYEGSRSDAKGVRVLPGPKSQCGQRMGPPQARLLD
jgi:hypothetical protein